ncbi:putative flavin-containing monooxygenase YUCCA3 [Paraphaeosphaeria sporulosa]|uniref:Putative flavin-containing monooxygenase YUCCA3 n=1 Tax=Paraphaeosphaeria sporulosa TaxID=1460663 RepID=A0A177CIR7_9PLEO|nr:putative flavin-containing monooxygenase YUCCA3 [Paraphaeosphaeria sporulosa]OAG06677.1 putative flavin-containing monooxygenase YUCCA3 [Paraphaeosphaeria sporulosa]
MLAKYPHDVTLPTFTKHDIKAQAPERREARSVAQAWLDNFFSFLSSNNVLMLPALLHADSWWRDFLTLTWDLRTIRSLPNITSFLNDNLSKTQFSSIRLEDESHPFAPHYETPLEGLEWIVSLFHFETKIGRGKGVLRLVQGDDGTWKAHFLSTALLELKGHEEATGTRRKHGGNNALDGTSGGMKGGLNWQEKRDREKEFSDTEPDVFVVGAGQAGLNVAARLQALNMSVLVVDKNERVGDNWRHRYRTLVTHDPVQYTHMAYMPFPSAWPLFTPKDKLADWFEIYASALELNVWTSSTISSASYSDVDAKWTVIVTRSDGKERTLRPAHVIFCTGHSGVPLIPTFPGQDTFRGTVYHASQHKDALQHAESLAGKNVVVNQGNSGHDIAQNYHLAGAASVTMLQRRGTYVIQASKGLFMLHEGMYEENGPLLEDADVFANSLPNAVQFALNVALTKRIRAAEKENLDGLSRAGFNVDFGHDGSGIYRKYITRGGGYYIDVGCSALIISGKIQVVQSPNGIECFDENGLVLAPGASSTSSTHLPADVVVLATGYANMRTSVAATFGEAEAARCKDVWDLDEEGEVNAMWRPTGHPGLWFMGGNLALCRVMSRYLALQIKARGVGLV